MQKLKQKYYDLFKSELFDSCLPFWLNNAADTVNGGIYNCLDRYGKVYSTDKSVWMHGRAAWMLSHICNTFGKDERCQDMAESCLKFLNKHCIDSDGRMFFTVTAQGQPLRKRRYWFSEAFYVIANAEYYLAFGDKNALIAAKNYFDFIYSIYSQPQNDPYKITPKSYAQTRSLKDLARPMILLNTALIMARADTGRIGYYQGIASAIVAELKNFYFPEYDAMLENITEDNRFLSEVSEGRIINPGHVAECAWFLADYSRTFKDETALKFAEKIFRCALKWGWDEEYGGIFYFKDILHHPVQAYEHDMKLWWPHNEAIITALVLYKDTGNSFYRQWFEKLTKYSFDCFSDKEHGEWLGYLRRDGKPTEPPCKGHTYKGPFHTMRMLAKVVNIFDGKDV